MHFVVLLHLIVFTKLHLHVLVEWYSIKKKHCVTGAIHSTTTWSTSFMENRGRSTCGFDRRSLPVSAPGGNQVNPRLTLVHAGWACSQREKKGESARKSERDGFRSGTRPEPQRAVTKRSVRHTYARTLTRAHTRVSKLDGFLT